MQWLKRLLTYITHGRTIEGMLAAAAYIVCRETGTPRTIKDIAAALNIKRKDISRNYGTLVLELDIKMPLADPMKCVVNVANKLGVSEKTKYQAMATMSEVVNSKINAGKVPLGFAASALCVMYEEW
jgi:transcription initiation factor TFIIB